MTDITLIYPYFKPENDRSIFRVPPLGLGYMASQMRNHGFSVDIMDCTFMKWKEAVDRLKKMDSSIIGIYSMLSMGNNAIYLAKMLRKKSKLLVAGGPLPSSNPDLFLDHFDIVVKGEGEQTFLELVEGFLKEKNFLNTAGIFFRSNKITKYSGNRSLIRDLDTLPSPARDLFPNKEYIKYWNKRCMPAKTSIITTRGCPYSCDFCSNPIFGMSYRERSAENVVDEIEETLKLGYPGIFFVDDCFTLNKKRIIKICDLILERKIDFSWECLSRIDNIGLELTRKMKKAGCKRIFFGIESGNERILKIMNKKHTLKEAKRVVENVASVGIDAGAFFIIGYPGETDQTILDTINFSNSLPLEYLSFTLPYPIPGTNLYEKVKNELLSPDWIKPRLGIIDHSLLYKSHFSSTKLKFAIFKGSLEFQINKRFGKSSWLIKNPVSKITEQIFKSIK